MNCPSTSTKLQALQEKKRESLFSKEALQDNRKLHDGIGGNVVEISLINSDDLLANKIGVLAVSGNDPGPMSYDCCGSLWFAMFLVITQFCMFFSPIFPDEAQYNPALCFAVNVQYVNAKSFQENAAICSRIITYLEQTRGTCFTCMSPRACGYHETR